MTNVSSNQLNYDKYTSDQYDRDIVNSIPFHRELHELLLAALADRFSPDQSFDILDLGVGTGITSAMILEQFPHIHLDVVDFSEQMLDGATKKLGSKATYLLGDYSEMTFDKTYDLVVSVIGLHHQDTAGKQRMFQKIFDMLKPGGVFAFGDLVTYRDPHDAAFNNAKHFHHLVEHAADESALREWAYHHQFLNDLAPIEDQVDWLNAVGFNVEQKLLKWNTALLICQKPE